MAETKGTTTSSERRQENTGSQRSQGQEIQRRQPQGGEGLARPEMFTGGPFQMMRRMSEEMDRAFDRLLGDFGFGGVTRAPFATSQAAPAIWTPRIEAFQKDDKFIVRAELPGVNKDDVEVNVTDDAITIQGQRREEHERREEGFYHTERIYGRFYRTIPLPEGVITDSAKASFRDGMLEIQLQAPPNEVRRGRRVEIQEESGQGREQGRTK